MTTSAAPAPVVRRGARAAALAIAPVLALMAAPAHAEAGADWSSPDPVDPTHTLLWFVLAPVGLFVLIALLTVLPALIRREPLLPKHGAADEAQWIGGPEKGAHELPPVEQSDSRSGGASGSW